MIQQTTAYRVGESFLPTIQEAQQQEILDLIEARQGKLEEGDAHVAKFIVDHADELVAILTCKPRTKKVRSDKGTKRKDRATVGEATK